MCTTQSEIFFSSLNIMIVLFSFDVQSLNQVYNITYSSQNSRRFSMHFSTTCVRETMSIFSCFMYNARHCSVIYLYKKTILCLKFEMCVGVCVHQLLTHLPSCFGRAPSCEGSLLHPGCGVCREKTFSDVLAGRSKPVLYFTCLELQSLN